MTTGPDVKNLYTNASELDIVRFSTTLVVAPHPDDETLGCGGTIALLRQAQADVHVVFVSDGSMSHPGSKKYNAEAVTALRKKEAEKALAILGVPARSLHFMRLKDSKLPAPGEPEAEEAARSFLTIIGEIAPKTIVLPWRRDPHKDHRAAWHIVQAALLKYHLPVVQLEYFIWLWVRSDGDDLPKGEEAQLCKVCITPVRALKEQAIQAHVSQVTNLIDDDPGGFILSPEVLANFSGHYELFAFTPKPVSTCNSFLD